MILWHVKKFNKRNFDFIFYTLEHSPKSNKAFQNYSKQIEKLHKTCVFLNAHSRQNHSSYPLKSYEIGNLTRNLNVFNILL